MEKPIALIVEDDRDILALFRHVLDIAGYHTEIVQDGKEAMHRLDTLTPQIVLLDMQLPKMSGMDILKNMRANERLKHIPVVVITAYAPIAESLPVEPDLLLLKPVDIHQLSSLVQRLQVTQGAISEPSEDKTTGLYTFSFFSVRLAFSLERIKQSSYRRFGVLFAEVSQLDTLKKQIGAEKYNFYFRKLADQFRTTLRPTDTMAWSEKDNMFLTLIEDIPTPETPNKIAERVQNGMKRFLENHNEGIDVKLNLGVLLCNENYSAIKEIIKDISLASHLLNSGTYPNASIFSQETLKKHQ
jgi:two-component system, cell cycle response regulator DivK